MKIRAALLLATLIALPAVASTPEEDWKAGIARSNEHYNVTPHAMLKIQDAIYLGEGDEATLAGTKGDPASWTFRHDADAKGPLDIR